MAPRITHSKVSSRPSGNDPGRVYGPDWNDDHVISGLTIGTDVQAHDATLDGLAALSGPTGIVAETAADIFANRTITGTAAEITVTFGDGVSGDPTISIPASVTFTGKTITGGTFSAPTINNATIATPTITSATFGNTNTVTLKDTLFTLQDDGDTTKQVQFQLSGISTGTTRTLTLPDGSTTLLGASVAATVSNKTFNNTNTYVLKDSITTFQDDADATKQGVFQMSGIATGTTRTLTWPDANTTIVGTDATQTLTSKTINGSSNTLTVLAGTQLSGQVPIANGGTAQATAAAARGSSGLNVESFTGHGDSIYTILATDKVVGTNAAFTASRTWTLPAANAVNAGQPLVVADFQGTVTGTNTLVIARAGADTINGSTSVTISAANGAYELWSDGSSKWTAQAIGPSTGGGNVSNTGTPTSGQIAVWTNATTIQGVSIGSSVSNSLAADAALSSTASYTTGPTCAQGTSGTWLAAGTVTLLNSNADTYTVKLWDGTTIAASTIATVGVNARYSIALSGVFTTPAGNIRISVIPITTTTGNIKANDSGNSHDSTLTVVRIA